MVDAKQCHYKSGDLARIVDSKFKRVTERVAIVGGQQRVLVEVEGLCLVATTYLPSAFIDILNK